MTMLLALPCSAEEGEGSRVAARVQLIIAHMQADELNYNPHPRIFITLKEYQLNKKLIASAIGMLLAANGAFAQSASNNSVELYGIIDLGVGHVENSLTADANFPASVNDSVYH